MGRVNQTVGTLETFAVEYFTRGSHSVGGNPIPGAAPGCLVPVAVIPARVHTEARQTHMIGKK